MEGRGAVTNIKPTKQFLMDQIEACKIAIQQNQGAINLCTNMLNSGCFMEEGEKGASDGTIDKPGPKLST